MFIPFFNLYWIFVAFGAFAKDWNRIMNSYPNLRLGPRLGEGTFLTYAICSIVFLPVAMVMHFIVFAEICKAINFMANRHLQPQGMTPSPGGIKLY
ncbi:MAG: hypothetical protein GWO24_18465 [Akkermansiaceae bacterium]|nr:hypothetical protein [Akkermansiaceae bacterium]